MFTSSLYTLGDPRMLKMIMIFYIQVHKFNDSKGTHIPAFACHALLAKVVECQMEIVNNHNSIVQGLQWVDDLSDLFIWLSHEYFVISVILKKLSQHNM